MRGIPYQINTVVKPCYVEFSWNLLVILFILLKIAYWIFFPDFWSTGVRVTGSRIFELSVQDAHPYFNISWTVSSLIKLEKWNWICFKAYFFLNQVNTNKYFWLFRPLLCQLTCYLGQRSVSQKHLCGF